jgi:hypothetical protein
MVNPTSTICILLIIATSSLAKDNCDCTHYSSQTICDNSQSCYWSTASNECLDHILDCTEATKQTDCSPPGCEWSNAKCQAFAGCTNYQGTLKDCKAYGCLATKTTGSGPCADYPGCDAIVSPTQCQGLQNR